MKDIPEAAFVQFVWLVIGELKARHGNAALPMIKNQLRLVGVEKVVDLAEDQRTDFLQALLGLL